MSQSHLVAPSSFDDASAGSKSKRLKPAHLQNHILLTFVLLLGTLCSSVYAADQDTGGGTSGSSVGNLTIILSGAGVGVLAIAAIALFAYRRQRQPTRRGSSTGQRSPRSRLPSDALFRHTVSSPTSPLSPMSPRSAGIKSQMNGKSRRKAPPSAIMVEVPPASLPSGHFSPATQSVGLHVPPSPAYDFRGRTNASDMPVTPRTPCMTFPPSTQGDADRMV